MSYAPVPVARRLPAGRGLLRSVRATVRAAAFWLAVALPLAYLPLVALAPAWFVDPTVLLAAVVGNLLALVVGHGHEPSLGRLLRAG